MNDYDLIALEADEQNRITRALDMDSATPVEVRGGDVVFVDELARTDDDQALHRVGDRPIATTSVHSTAMVRNALSAAGYESDHIAFALATELGESAPSAARIAESTEHDHPAQIESVATDGGEPSAARRTSSEIVSDGGTAVEHTTTATADAEEPETCDRCDDALSGALNTYTTPWHDDYDEVCGSCLNTDDVDPAGDDDRFRLPEDPDHVPEPTVDDDTGRWGDTETVTNAHGDEVPKRSEHADFGGGESNGVQEL